MILKHRVSLGGAQLDELDNRIIIAGIKESKPKETISTVSLMGGSGSRITGRHRDSIDVTVTFRLDIRKRDMEEREGLLEMIRGWAAGGGVLEVNYRPDRILRVACVENAEGGDAWEWTQDYSIVFRAMGVPNWQTKTWATGSTGTATSGRVYVDVPGNTKTVGEVTVKNMSGAVVNTVSVNFGEAHMVFNALGLAANESLVIDHNNDGILRLRIRNAGGSYRSAMAMRQSISSDDLYVDPGRTLVTYSAQRACQMTASCRGRFV